VKHELQCDRIQTDGTRNGRGNGKSVTNDFEAGVTEQSLLSSRGGREEHAVSLDDSSVPLGDRVVCANMNRSYVVRLRKMLTPAFSAPRIQSL
jgi:hypothetical protein